MTNANSGGASAWREIVRQANEINRLRAQLAGSLIGSKLVSTVIVGNVPPASGGTGIVGSALGVTVWKSAAVATRTQGDVVIFKAGSDRQFDITTTVSTRRVIGVLDGSAEVDGQLTVATGAEGRIRHVGYQAVVNVTGAVAAGDYLQASATAGRAQSTGTDALAGVFARAVTAFAGPGTGTVAAYLFASPEMLQEQITAKGDLLVGAAAGDLDTFPVSNNDGYVLSASPASTLGVEWRAAAAGSAGGPVWIPFGSDISAGDPHASDAYAQFGYVERLLNPTMWTFSPLHVVLEVVLKTSAGKTAKMRLYDVTAGAAVGSSEVSTTSSTPVRLRSPLLTLNAGAHRYIVQLGGDTGGTYTGYDAVLIIGGAETTAGGVEGGGAIPMLLAGFGSMGGP